jgi:hypothetical protein
MIHSKTGCDCGAYAAKILDLLPHTPVQAIGSNFAFHADLGDWPSDHLPCLGPVPGKGAEISKRFDQVQWQGVRNMGEGTQLQVTLTQRQEEGVVLAYNLHRNVASAKQAREFAASWERDRDVVVADLGGMFGVKLP